MSDDVARRRFDGRVAVVTGGAAGIGGAVTRLLAAEGALVVVVDRDEAALDRTVADVEAFGSVVVAVLGDIRDAAVVDRLVDAALGGPGRVDVLVNNVGDFRPAARTFLESTEEQWRDQHETNLLHVLRCCHRFVPGMVERGGGAVVNVATVEAFRGIPGHSVYSAYKAGVVEFTRSLAVEVGRHGVRVNAVAPDMADTPQTPAARMLNGRDPQLVGSWIPLGRFGHPDDHAEVIAFLASDAARFVTGVTVPVDGGTLAASGWYGRAGAAGWTNLPTAP